MIRVFTYDTPEQLGAAAASLVAAQLMRKPESVLGLATGSSPVTMYQALIGMYERGEIDFSKAVSYNLDEYVGIDYAHEQSYHRFMDDHLFNHVDMRREAIHVPDGNNADPAAFAASYDAAIDAAGGIDLQVLGIGRNGHIGFNEPNDHFVSGCHVVDLTPSTIEANKRFFASADEVPKQAMSLGIGQIMKAKLVVLIAIGAEKADAVAASVNGPVTPAVQGSILQYHPNVIFLTDKAAAAKL